MPTSTRMPSGLCLLVSILKSLVLCILAGLLLLAVPAAPPSHAGPPAAPLAATIGVTTTADEYDTNAGACSLREAIQAANTDTAFGGCPAGSGTDTINLPAGTYRLTLTNAGGLNEDNNATGDLDINANLTLQGAGAGSTFIQAGTNTSDGIDKVLGVNPYCNSGVNVTIDGVTVRYGRNTQAFGAIDFGYTGGGLDWCGGTGADSFTLSNAVVSDNTNVNGYGGGLNLDSLTNYTGAINLTNVTFQDNRTLATTNLGQGGGLNIYGHKSVVTIDGCQFLNNSTAHPGIAQGAGGGINVRLGYGGSVQIHNTTISGNTAGGQGGGVYVDIWNVGTVVTIDQDTRILNNVSGGVAGGSAGGGGIAINGGGALSTTPVTLSKVTITGNSESALSSTRDGGGGILVRYANVTVEYSRLANNSVLSANGGTGLYKDSSTGTVTATNNWWGCSTGPGTAPCDTAVIAGGSSGSLTSAPYLRLSTTAAASPLVTNQSTTLTASFRTNSAGADVSAHLDRLIGLGVTWSAIGGSLSGQQATIQADGTATAGYQATAAGAGQVAAVVDNDTTAGGRPNVASITINKADTTLAITSDAPDPSSPGQAVTVQYTLAGAQGSSPTAPTGSVTVGDGVDSNTCALPATSCNVTLTTPGSRTLTASYSGDANFNAGSDDEPHTVDLPPAPEIDVRGNDQSIPDGDTSPSTLDHTDFGSAAIGGGQITHTFTISNSGDLDLTLTGTPRVTVTGPAAGDFSVVVQPGTPVGVGLTTTFQVRFAPSVIGTRSVTVIIANDDPDENPYDWAIRGTGTLPTVSLSVSANGGTEAAQTVITVVATASANVVGDQTVNVGVSGAGITAGDYSLSSDTLTIPNGQSSGSVTWTIQDDALDEDTETATLAISNPSAGIVLGSTTSQDVTITDDDTRGVTITPSGGVTAVAEGGTTDTYTVVLDSQPTANVTIAVNAGPQIEIRTGVGAYGSTLNLTFTTANWDTPQMVEVRAVDDTTVEGDHNATITHSAGGGDYAGASFTPGSSVAVAIADNDQSFAITAEQATVVEGSGSNTTIRFTVTRTGGVTTTAGTVGLILSGDATNGVDYTNVVPASPVSLAAGETDQIITIDVVGDFVVEPDEVLTVTLSNPSGPGSSYPTTAAAQTLIADDDDPGVTILPTSGLTTTESGGTALLTVRLNTQPTANVTVTLSSSDTGEGTVSPALLVFTPANWVINRPVTVTGVDDLLADGDVVYTIHTAATSSDSDYGGLDPDDVTVTNVDNDTPGYIMSPNPLTVREGTAEVVRIALRTRPTADVTIDLSSSDPTECAVSPISVTLNAANWQSGASLTVSGVNDGLSDGEQPCTIVTTVRSGDGVYDALDPADISVTVQEEWLVYLPLVMSRFAAGADLVVDSLTAGPGGPRVTIRNAGRAAATDAFWVDVYYDPNPAPPPLNQTWLMIAPYGAHWGATALLAPGESLTLTIGGAYYRGGSSAFPAGAQVYACVDSYNVATTYGNVLEIDEGNNVWGPVASTAGRGVGAVIDLSPPPAGLPDR